MLRGTLLFAVAGGLALPACGSPCGGREASDHPNAPEATNFSVLPSQLPGDPCTVFFGIEFTDANGDLSGGRAEMFINSSDSPAIEEDLGEIFHRNGLAADAETGGFWLAVVFNEESVQDGSTVRTSLQLVDGADMRSNCFSLDLEFDVTDLASATPKWRLAGGCHARGSS